jgi:serine/threonine protein kinase
VHTDTLLNYYYYYYHQAKPKNPNLLLQSSDHLFLVMDYCAGGEFFRMLKSQPERRIAEDWVRFYARECCLRVCVCV